MSFNLFSKVTIDLPEELHDIQMNEF